MLDVVAIGLGFAIAVESLVLAAWWDRRRAEAHAVQAEMNWHLSRKIGGGLLAVRVVPRILGGGIVNVDGAALRRSWASKLGRSPRRSRLQDTGCAGGVVVGCLGRPKYLRAWRRLRIDAVPAEKEGGMALDVGVLRAEVQKVYSDVAHDPKKGYHFHTGREYAEKMLGYPIEWLDAVPPEVLASFAGVGCPLSLGPVRAGETVLDVGSGAGIDSFIAASLVEPTGRVIGLDMTEAMLAKAIRWREEWAIPHLDFRRGLAEEIPLPDDSVDVVVSNGVINLTPDKGRVFRDIHRVLRPGGRLQIADIVVQKDIPAEAREQVDIWTA